VIVADPHKRKQFTAIVDDVLHALNIPA